MNPKCDTKCYGIHSQIKFKNFPDQGSRYQIAFSDIEAFLARADIVIKDMLSLNRKWCNIMACINRNTQCFLGTGTVDLEKQKNFRILLKPQMIELSNPGFLNDNPEYVKQRTVEWFNNRRRSRIMASTMHNALGLRTLKAQKDHFELPVVNGMDANMEQRTSSNNVYKFVDKISSEYLDAAEINQEIYELCEESCKLIVKAHNLQKASDVLLFVCTDSDRSFNKEKPSSMPLAYALKGHSIRISTARKMINIVCDCLKQNGTKILCEAVDGQWSGIVF